MGKKIENNSLGDSATLEITSEAVEGLMRSVRWTEAEATEVGPKEGVEDTLQTLLQRPQVEAQTVDIERLMLVTSDDIIDRFLRTEPRRIVAEDGEPESEIVTEAELDDEDEFVSEELAEVYLKQGLKEEAKATYRKLSLLNPEKSVYFAGIISNIDSNN